MKTTFSVRGEHETVHRCGRNHYQGLAKAYTRPVPLPRPVVSGKMTPEYDTEDEGDELVPPKKMLIELHMTFQYPPSLEEIRNEIKHCLSQAGR